MYVYIYICADMCIYRGCTSASASRCQQVSTFAQCDTYMQKYVRVIHTCTNACTRAALSPAPHLLQIYAHTHTHTRNHTDPQTHRPTDP